MALVNIYKEISFLPALCQSYGNTTDLFTDT